MLTKFLKQAKRSEEGMALLMVISAVTLLTWLLADLTFETQLNKIRGLNYQEKVQAKLNAQSGLNFALGKLRIYKEARNLLEKNESLKGTVKPNTIEKLIIAPFVYPIPVPKKASIITKDAIKEFEDETFMEGGFRLGITKIKGFLNPNNMRIPPPKPNQNQNQNQNQGQQGQQQGQDDQTPPHLYMEKKLIEMMTNTFETQKEKDETFDALYGNLDPELLIKELKFYVNNPNSYDDGSKPQVESLYLDSAITPKHAPMNSISELYLLQGWPDAIVDLVKDKLTVHEVSVISLNDLTQDTLKVIFPNITPVQIEEYFRFKNGDPELGEEPQEFKSVDDFKKVIVDQLGITDNEGFDKREKEFESAGLKFGTAGSLYRVESIGTYKKSEYKLVAYVEIPTLPKPEKPANQNGNGQNNNGQNGNGQNGNGQNSNGQNGNGQNGNGQNGNQQKPEPIQFMEPRVVEIIRG